MKHKLFLPYENNALELKNRIVMAPMTRCRSGEGDIPTPLMAEYYVQRATAGLIVTEGIPVSPKSRGYLWTPGIYTEEQITGWKKITRAVHDEGGNIFAQIWHVGRISHYSLQPNNEHPESPTSDVPEGATCFAYDEDGNPANVPTSPPVSVNLENIARIRDEFAQAALNSIESGMDGVEIHGANGYLFDQFINSVVNTRNDEYGGSTENRCRLLLETVDTVASAIGAERTGVRISPNGRFNAMPEDPQMEATFLYLTEELQRRGIAYLHINDQASFGLPAIPDGLILKIRDVFKGPIILCGGYDAIRACEAVDSGLADLVAFGISYLANPDLPTRMENNWPLNTPDMETLYGGGEKGYTDYPTYKE